MTKKYFAPQTSNEKIIFDGAPVVVLNKPRLWNCCQGDKTEVQAVWNSSWLHVGYKIFGSFEPFNDLSAKKFDKETDHRVEVFIIPSTPHIYYGYEANPYMQFLDFKGTFGQGFDPSWRGSAKAELCSKDGLPFMIISIPWSDIGFQSLPSKTGMKIGFYRGQPHLNQKGKIDLAWTCWIDPGTEPLSFHQPGTFGELELVL
jgi:hypothetical protein